MNVLITGGTGFLGRALTMRLRRDGHRVTVLTRNTRRATSLLGREATALDISDDPVALTSEMERTDAVINLAGEPLLGGRWRAEKKARLRSSRIDGTRHLVEAIGKAENRPRVMLSASAVGFYGDGGDRILTEEDAPGSDFLALLCRDWEAEASRASEFGVRVVLPRIGVVLGRGGGALDQMLTPFRMGVGGPIGSGRQYVPWIHLEDLVELMACAIEDERFHGPLNAAAPEPMTFSAFARSLGAALSRPAVLPLPAPGVRLLFGEASVVLLQGQRAVPRKALGLGFEFRFSDLGDALRDLLDGGGVSIGPISGPLPDSDYLRSRPPRFLLESRTILPAPLKEVFPFFSRAENLGLITPPGMRFQITHAPETMGAGAEIDYRLKVGPVPINWRTRIDVWEEGERFVDSQARGPYASWWHEHRFEPSDNGTVMTDRVYYAPPLGLLGRAANAVFVADQLRDVFGYRTGVMRLRFGVQM